VFTVTSPEDVLSLSAQSAQSKVKFINTCTCTYESIIAGMSKMYVYFPLLK